MHSWQEMARFPLSIIYNYQMPNEFIIYILFDVCEVYPLFVDQCSHIIVTFDLQLIMRKCLDFSLFYFYFFIHVLYWTLWIIQIISLYNNEPYTNSKSRALESLKGVSSATHKEFIKSGISHLS